MATVTGARAASTFPAYSGLGAGNLCRAYGHYDYAAEPAASDVLELCRIPAGAVILGGFIRMGDMDSNATETLDFDVGTAADPDMLGNFGVNTGDAVVGYLPEGGILLPLHGLLATSGPITTSVETVIQVTFVDDPATFDSGNVTVCVDYVTP
jgi:hypothetical protein